MPGAVGRCNRRAMVGEGCGRWERGQLGCGYRPTSAGHYGGARDGYGWGWTSAGNGDGETLGKGEVAESDQDPDPATNNRNKIGGKTMKRTTVRFYSEDGKYCGWNYIDKTTYRQLRGWVRSSNSFIIENNSFTLVNWPKFVLSGYSKLVK